MKSLSRLIIIALILLLILNPVAPGKAAPDWQGNTPEEQARSLLDRMTPEERVGQLFLVTFTGPEAGPSSQIYDLITQHHVGGVILKASNDNFLATDQTASNTIILTRQLQRAEYLAAQTDHQGPDGSYRPNFVPLFIGMAQEGDGYPYDQILNGLTPLPSEMAIGATWKPSLAQQVGNVQGKELSLLGFNFLLGPSLDVLESPHSEGTGDLGVRTFGGDIYWVGEMGRAYITGVHQGSNGKIAVVAKHFPGYGSSDRLPEDEVATVRKSLEQLKTFELVPFFAVTGNAPSPDATADALLTAHIRYQGFHENIRTTTKPVSFDPQVFSELIALPQLASWRDNGGMMVSDELGGPALRRFYKSTGQTFEGRSVARDAFLAGNDLLFTGDMSSENGIDSYESMLRTLDFFTQKYRDDPVFAQRVNDSVLRILTLKYRLYPAPFTLTSTLAPQELPATIGTSGKVTSDIIQNAATLVNLSQADLPDPPGRNDHIVFITDTRNSLQCSKCPLKPSIQVNALEQVVVRMYGPEAGGQVLPGNLISYSFNDLNQLLQSGPGLLQIENDLKAARWMVFVMLNPDPNIQSSSALKQFLSQRPELLQQKRIVVFALNAPYYLDATDISKITVYYALYSKVPQSIDVAARLLFWEARANGALPVSVSGVGYDLNVYTFPDPNQTIPLMLDLPNQPPTTTQTPTTTPQDTPTVQYRINDTIPVRTGVILDHNGHQVPDNTIVHFIVSHGEGGPGPTVEAQTVGGIAKATIRVDSAGVFEIRAESELAKNSDVLRFDIPNENVTAVPPTQTPTSTATPTLTPSPTLTATPAPTPPPPKQPRHTNLGEWLLALSIAASIFVGSYWLASLLGQVRWGVRGGLLSLIGGMLAYSYLAIGMPGSDSLVESAGPWAVLGFTLLGAGIGWLAAIAWRQFTLVKKTP